MPLVKDLDIRDDEDLEDLQINGYKLLQKKTGFRFGVDSVLLSDFVNERAGYMLDLCSGSGIIPILCMAKNKVTRIEAVEIIENIADMANRNFRMNGIFDVAKVRNDNICNIKELYTAHIFDFVTCNPPYMKAASGFVSPDDRKAMARTEISCTIDDVASAASFALRSKGRFYLIHRAYRLVDVFSALTKYNLEPKRMRLVSSAYDKKPTMVLIEAVKDGNRQLNIEPNLIV